MTLRDRMRLIRLEMAQRPADNWGDREWEEYRWLGGSSLHDVIERFAKDLAERRWLHATGHRGGELKTNGTWYEGRGEGWVWHLTDDERQPLIERELIALQSLLGIMPLRDAIRAWLDDLDTAGWPHTSRPNVTPAYDQFVDQLARHRDMMRVHRNGIGSIADVWRRHHADWSPSLTPEEYDEWEASLLTKEAA